MEYKITIYCEIKTPTESFSFERDSTLPFVPYPGLQFSGDWRWPNDDVVKLDEVHWNHARQQFDIFTEDEEWGHPLEKDDLQGFMDCGWKVDGCASAVEWVAWKEEYLAKHRAWNS